MSNQANRLHIIFKFFAIIYFFSTPLLLSAAAIGTYYKTNAVGNGVSSSTGNGGPATSATCDSPSQYWGDTLGNMYLLEGTPVNKIRKIGAASPNIISAIAGIGTKTSSGDNGKATAAALDNPRQLQGWGDIIYVTEMDGNKIRAVDLTTNIITTVVGTGVAESSGDGASATAASLNAPFGIWVDSNGSMWISEYTIGRIRRVRKNTNLISFFAGLSVGVSGDGGLATAAQMSSPRRLYGDGTHLYIPDSEANQIRKIEFTSSIISLVVGTGAASSTGDNGMPTSANINVPKAVWGDSAGFIYIPEYSGHKVRRINPNTNRIITIAGTGTLGSGGNNGPALNAQMNGISSIFVDTVGAVYYVEWEGSVVARLTDITISPTFAPSTATPSRTPTVSPTRIPTTIRPSATPSNTPTRTPTIVPTIIPTSGPTVTPSTSPSAMPSITPTLTPALSPTTTPSATPTTSAPDTPTRFVASAESSYKARNALSFAAINCSGSVFTWGAAASGGNSSQFSSLLQNVTTIVSGVASFAALTSDGNVVAWGEPRSVINCSAYYHEQNINSIVSVVASNHAYAWITASGGVGACGSRSYGGDVLSSGILHHLRSDVVSITPSAGAFAALKSDGNVFAWGNVYAGGGVTSLTTPSLHNVCRIFATSSAFAALRRDGSVVSWGESPVDSTNTQQDATVTIVANHNITAIVANQHAFAGVTANGSVVTWGAACCGGNSSMVADHLRGNVTQIVHTDTSFSALKTDGSAITWGKVSTAGAVTMEGEGEPAITVVASSGGIVPGVHNVTKIYTNRQAYAAVTYSGSVVAWGNGAAGGEIPDSIAAMLTANVSSVHSTNQAFAVLKTDGSVIVWGNPHYGGNVSSEVAQQLASAVMKICANQVAFMAFKGDGSYVVWGNNNVVISSTMAEQANARFFVQYC